MIRFESKACVDPSMTLVNTVPEGLVYGVLFPQGDKWGFRIRDKMTGDISKVGPLVDSYLEVESMCKVSLKSDFEKQYGKVIKCEWEE